MCHVYTYWCYSVYMIDIMAELTLWIILAKQDILCYIKANLQANDVFLFLRAVLKPVVVKVNRYRECTPT